MFTKKELLDAVKIEANNLRTLATQEEKNKLDFYNLDGVNYYKCIYGQMTGHCSSERAKQLIHECTPFYLYNGNLDVHPFTSSFKRFREVKSTNVDYLSRGFFTITYLSAIEVLLFFKTNKKNIKELVEYIKGNADTLTF